MAHPLAEQYGLTADELGRRWLSIEKDESYAKDSELRFRIPVLNGKVKAQPALFDLA
jgi:hypothetical protein